MGTAQAAPGDLDLLDFGLQGLVTTDFSAGNKNKARAVAIQADGKIVAAGSSNEGGSVDFALARHNTDGSLDTAFNPLGPTPGLVTTDFSGGSFDEAFAVAIQDDGKIVAVGRTNAAGNDDFALARYNTDGSLDTAFNPSGPTPGLATTAFSAGSIDQASAVAIQADGKIVAAGSSDEGGNVHFALARYNTDGSLDTAFNPSGPTPGLVTTNFPGGNKFAARAVAIQADGKIVVAGLSYHGPLIRDFALARFNTDGSLDTAFNPSGPTPGLVTTDFSGGRIDEAFAVAIQDDGKIVAAGITDAAGSDDFALARYNTDGSLDSAFNPLGPTPGLVTTDFTGGNQNYANAVAIQANGKIVAAGVSYTGADGDFALARYNTDGSLDSAFNPLGSTPGLVTTDFTGVDFALAVAIQADGKIVVAGSSNIGSGSSTFNLARYRGDTADLSIRKTVSASSVGIGDDLTYTITVKNDGLQPVGNVVVSDTLVGTVSFGAISPSQGSCSGTKDLICNLGTLADGASATVMVSVTATAAGGISNIAQVTGQAVDPDPADNFASAFVDVAQGASPSADLSITKTADPPAPAIGERVTYSLTVTNHGPDSASGVVVTDVLSGLFSDLSADSAQGTCTVSGPVICSLGNLASGDSVTLTITLTVVGSGPLSDLATVISQASDPDLSNNSAAVNLSVDGGTTGTSGTSSGGCSLNTADSGWGGSIPILLFLLIVTNLRRWRKPSVRGANQTIF